MFFRNSKKKSQKKLDELCQSVRIFIQVHFVPQRNSDPYKFNILSLKNDPDREKLQEFLAEHGNPDDFSSLCLLFLEQTGKDENYICDRSNLERGFFSKLHSDSDYRPSKPEVIALCFAMNLNIEEARVLLKSAGYALTNSSESDLIIRYFIEEKNYSLSELDYVLKQLCDTKLEEMES